MLQTLKLLLPALVPSWRFFDAVAPSPRIEIALLETEQSVATQWQVFRPRPAHLSLGSMIKRLFWNPEGNESLFLISCAERLMEHPTDHSVAEIHKRLETGITTPYFQFRLVFVNRRDKDIAFISPVYRIRP